MSVKDFDGFNETFETYEDALDAMAKKLNTEINETPVDGIFKVKVSRVVSPEDKAETERLLEYLAEALGRPDITIMVEGLTQGDLN